MSRIESILKTLIDNLEEGIHIVDNEGRTIYYNEAMSRIEGLEPDKVIGKRVTEVLKGMKEDSSTLMNAIKHNSEYKDIIQKYNGYYGKEVTTINTSIPIKYKDNVVGAVEISKDMTRLKELSEKICKLENINREKKEHYRFKDIITKDQAMEKEINKGLKASLSNSSVLIYGETGCGKELFAQSIHYNGIRNGKPFIAINCAAIPNELLEGLLFGTVKGSFTGAENKKGLFEEANKGTLLLDEVNSMPVSLQSKLLRVLQEGYIRPIGGNKDIDIDVRVIATLNEEPEKLMEQGKLRKDFYYRLSVIKINVPPLRNRKEDIPLLTDNFIRYYNRILGKNITGLSEEIIESFLQYNWPGNVRELKNVIESAMNMARHKDTLTKEYFENNFFKSNVCKEKHYTEEYIDSKSSLQEYLEKIECRIIKQVLKEHNYNISRSAAQLKISRQNLQYKMKKYNLP